MLDGIFRVAESVSDNEGLARIAHKANQDYDSLTAEELSRFDAYADRCFGSYENVFYNARHGMIEPDLLSSWKRALEVDMLEPGLRRNWKTRRLKYLPDLTVFVDEFVRLHPLGAKSTSEVDDVYTGGVE